MLMLGDMNKDGRLDADEIAGALTAAQDSVSRLSSSRIQ